MTAPHYYASTSGILVDRFLKYGVFPVSLGVGYALFRNHDRATRFAQVTSLAMSSLITTSFLGLESEMIDNSGREAVSAAMGIAPDKVEWSTYKRSSNVIISKAYSDLMHLQWGRYGTDALFLLPIAIETAYKGMTGKDLPPTKNITASMENRPDLRQRFSYDPDRYSGMEKFLQGHVGWAMSPYAGKAAYWFYETFKVDKTAYYDVVKLRENLEATGKDIDPNDLKGIYQRARNDRKLPIVGPTAVKEHAALRELFTRMANAYNKHDGTFGIAEIVYLIGENKINIHAADNKTFSQAAVEQSHREIDKVMNIGLKGIREENRQRRLAAGAPGVADTGRPKTFGERFANSAVATIQDMLAMSRGAPRNPRDYLTKRPEEYVPRRPQEYISERDPTNLTGLSEMGR